VTTINQHKEFFRLNYAQEVTWSKPVRLTGKGRMSLGGKKAVGVSRDRRLSVELYTSIGGRVTDRLFTILLDTETLPRDLGCVTLMYFHLGMWVNAMDNAQWLIRRVIGMADGERVTERGIVIHKQSLKVPDAVLQFVHIRQA